MDRKVIKSEAKEKIKGNIWKILWPLIVIGFVSGFLNGILSSIFGVSSDLSSSMNELTEAMQEMVSSIETGVVSETVEETTTVSPLYSILSSILSLVTTFFTVAYLKYILNFIRTGEASFKDIVACAKENWLNILAASIAVSVVCALFSLLLVIPGIIRAIAYSFVMYIVIDEGAGAKDAMKKSREMMNGYKWDYVVFNLSFIGWYILIPFTLGLILIWLAPYHQVAEALYYENLKKVRG